LTKHFLGTLVVVVALGFATSCAPADIAGTPEALARAQTLRPTDARLAGLYEQSCGTCHKTLDSGAPLAGDKPAWAPRLKKGMPALVQSTVTGLNGMPAGGQCFACSSADYEALIRFMAESD
jgi:cytochrome c5